MPRAKSSILRRVGKTQITDKELQRLREFHDTVKMLQDEQFCGDVHSVRKYEYKQPNRQDEQLAV